MSETSNKTCVRFLHVSDIHLDAPFVGLPADKSEERRKVLRNTFMRLMQYIRDSKIDVVLISGDLFNTPHATNSTAEVLIREFSTCQDTYFIISPGKHDHYTANPIYTSGRLPDNVYIFSSDKLSRFDFEEYNVTVYGWAFMDAEMTENPIKGRHVDDGSRINLVCAYADLDGKAGTTCCPVSLADIKNFGADYYAFGSRHEASRFSQAGGSKYAYAGALECMGFDEPGLGGANLITVTYNKSSQSSEHTIENKKVSFGRVRFETEILDITGAQTGNEVISRISRMISDKKYDNETALRIELVGSIDPRFNIPTNMETEAFGLYYFSVVDKTMPLYGTEGFKRDMSVKGEIFRSYYPYLTSEDEEKRLIAAKAFRLALAALEKRELP